MLGYVIVYIYICICMHICTCIRNRDIVILQIVYDLYFVDKRHARRLYCYTGDHTTILADKVKYEKAHMHKASFLAFVYLHILGHLLPLIHGNCVKIASLFLCKYYKQNLLVFCLTIN